MKNRKHLYMAGALILVAAVISAVVLFATQPPRDGVIPTQSPFLPNAPTTMPTLPDEPVPAVITPVPSSTPVDVAPIENVNDVLFSSMSARFYQEGGYTCGPDYTGRCVRMIGSDGLVIVEMVIPVTGTVHEVNVRFELQKDGSLDAVKAEVPASIQRLLKIIYGDQNPVVAWADEALSKIALDQQPQTTETQNEVLSISIENDLPTLSIVSKAPIPTPVD